MSKIQFCKLALNAFKIAIYHCVLITLIFYKAKWVYTWNHQMQGLIFVTDPFAHFLSVPNHNSLNSCQFSSANFIIMQFQMSWEGLRSMMMTMWSKTRQSFVLHLITNHFLCLSQTHSTLLLQGRS